MTAPSEKGIDLQFVGLGGPILIAATISQVKLEQLPYQMILVDDSWRIERNTFSSAVSKCSFVISDADVFENDVDFCVLNE